MPAATEIAQDSILAIERCLARRMLCVGRLTLETGTTRLYHKVPNIGKRSLHELQTPQTGSSKQITIATIVKQCRRGGTIHKPHGQYRLQQIQQMEKNTERIDAGLASLNHYKIRLPPWRHQIRQVLLPIVRWETPYVAWLQNTMRTPALDRYFALTANLGTHTAFMVVLPILFWCGYVAMARAMVHILAAGVFWSGFVKDLLCLPRPLSPPLQRITMSGSAALEYGFPSTHSTNAVSVAYCALYILKYEDPNLSPGANTLLQITMYFYAGSIVLGRLYCGMHGFFDVVLGSLLGLAIGAVQCRYGPTFDYWLYNSNLRNIILIAIVVGVLVRIHPEPADDCPCFDDSVAFAGVIFGCEYASWHLAQQQHFQGDNLHAEIPFSLEKVGWLVASLRIILGVVAVFAWRATMKPLLLRVLPPLFRRIELVGLDLPRRFFMPASQYKSVPSQHKDDDNIIPDARDIPQLLSNLNRKRAISVGPQSQADAIEALAYREKKRRDSLTMRTPKPSAKDESGQDSYFADAGSVIKASGSHTRKRSSSLDQFRAQMGSVTSLPQVIVSTPLPEDAASAIDQEEQDLLEEKEMFARLQKPRVRYDVEVVTKLIVYAGIAWVSIEMNPRMFHTIGLS